MKLNQLCAVLNVTEDASELGLLTKKRPIASLPFAGRYRVIDFNLSSIAHAQVRSAAIFISGSGRSIYDHIRSGKPWDLDLSSGGIFTFSQMEHKKALYEAASRRGDFYEDHLEFLIRSKAEYVFVAGSKIIANVDIQEVFDQHIEAPGQITRIYKTVPNAQVLNRPKERLLHLDVEGKVLNAVEEGRVTLQGDTVQLDMNMSILKVSTLIEIIHRAEADDLNDNIDEIINHYLFDYSVNGYEYKGYLANIETVKDYYDTNMEMLNGANFTELFHGRLPVVTKGQNGVPTYFAKYANVQRSQFATGSEIYGDVADSIVFRKVKIADGAKVKGSIIMQGCKIGSGAVVEYAILDKDITVEPGARVIGTPDKPIVIAKHTDIRA